jgi:hypothetical protein
MEGPFDQFNQALSNMIPVVLRKKQLEQDQQQFDTVMQQRQAKLMEDARQAELKAANDVIQSSMEQATTTGMELYKAGDIKGAKAALTAAERIRMQAGLPPIMQLDETGSVVLEPPKQQIKGTPSSEFMDVYYAGGGALPTMDQIAAREKMQQRPSQEGGGERFQLWDTGAGPQRFGTKSGKLEAIPGYEGTLRATHDPAIQGAKTGATQEARKEADLQAKLKEEAPKVKAKLYGLNQKWDNLTGEKGQKGLIDKAISQIGPFTTGYGAYLRKFPSEAKDLEENLKTIRANIGIDELMKIKESGAGLGSVTEAEHELLQALQQSLDQFQSSGQLHDHLNKIKELLIETRAFNKEQFRQTYGKFTGEGGSAGAPSTTGLPEGFEED